MNSSPLWADAGINYIDGSSFSLDAKSGCRAKGFAGGFDNAALQAWGEAR